MNQKLKELVWKDEWWRKSTIKQNHCKSRRRKKMKRFLQTIWLNRWQTNRWDDSMIHRNLWIRTRYKKNHSQSYVLMKKQWLLWLWLLHIRWRMRIHRISMTWESIKKRFRKHRDVLQRTWIQLESKKHGRSQIELLPTTQTFYIQYLQTRWLLQTQKTEQQWIWCMLWLIQITSRQMIFSYCSELAWRNIQKSSERCVMKFVIDTLMICKQKTLTLMNTLKNFQTRFVSISIRNYNHLEYNSKKCIFILIYSTRDDNDIERISWFKTVESDSQERESPNESESERNHRTLCTIRQRWTRFRKQIQWWIRNQTLYFRIRRWKSEWLSVFQQRKSHGWKIRNIFQLLWKTERNMCQSELIIIYQEQKSVDSQSNTSECVIWTNIPVNT